MDTSEQSPPEIKLQSMDISSTSTSEGEDAVSSLAETQALIDTIKPSVEYYQQFRDEHDEAVKIGLFGKDLEDALTDNSTVLIPATNEKGEAVNVPLLVPAENVEWFNTSLLKKVYGENTDFYYYTTPPVEGDVLHKAKEVIRKKLEDGAVIFYDVYSRSTSDNDVLRPPVFDGQKQIIEPLGTGEVRREALTFIGPVTFNSVESVSSSVPTIEEVYQESVTNGDLEFKPQNGVALEQSVEGEDAERLWEIYNKPFVDLGVEHPAVTGFDKDSFIDILGNPEVVKFVNRVEGAISTLCFFVKDFDQCPWFNKEYFRDNYPEYFDSDNVLIFPGIVSDENMRGNHYSLDVIDLVTKLYAKRGSNLLVAFECTETSATYIPSIVKAAIENSGLGKIDGIDLPVSTTVYEAVRAA